MAESIGGRAPRRGGTFRGLAWLGGTLATAAALGVGAALAIVFAATLAVIAVMGAATLSLAALAIRARRTTHGGNSNLLEAHNVGGHSWVAYGWDRNAR